LFDIGYVGRRAADERAAAMNAVHPKAREAHLELAQAYLSLVKSIVRRERLLHLVDAA
jgi:hypothetical protein